MTPIDSLLAAKACVQSSENLELHKRFEESIKEIDAAIMHLLEWKRQVKIESEK